MPSGNASLVPETNKIKKNGSVVGTTDRIYSVVGLSVTFDEVLPIGDLDGELEYNGRTLVLESIDTMIGLEISNGVARGPVWKGVKCQVIRS